MLITVGLVSVIFVSQATGSDKTAQLNHYLKRYYHADGYIKSIGHVAHRTIYSSNPKIRHKWQRTVKYLVKVRINAKHHIDIIKHPTPIYKTNYWISKQIRVANSIAQSASSDPWPNCPDPVFNGARSWQDTVDCENGGNWYDSPGYYRCGLQFDPSWETKYGRLCP